MRLWKLQRDAAIGVHEREKCPCMNDNISRMNTKLQDDANAW